MSVGPLTAEEVQLIDAWLPANEGVRHRWELLSAQFLPLRDPNLLGKLYRDAKEGRQPNNNNYKPRDGNLPCALHSLVPTWAPNRSPRFLLIKILVCFRVERSDFGCRMNALCVV